MDFHILWRAKMLNFGIIRNLIFGPRSSFPDTVRDANEELPEKGLTMGTLIIGRPGTGKTSSLARHLVDYFETFKDRPIFVLDWSGSISESILTLIQQKAEDIREGLEERLVYDELGHPDLVIPLPEFSEDYGTSYEEQVQRVTQNLEKLEPELIERTPVVGGIGIKHVTPHLLRLISAIRNENGETWQVTEVKKLLIETNELNLALNEFGKYVPGAKFHLEHEYKNLKPNEQLLRRHAITSVLSPIEPEVIRARLGYIHPGWTPREAIEKNQLVLIDGSRLINQRKIQHYLFTQAYSLIMAEINKRKPGNPKDNPVSLVMDEVYSLLSIKGMAEEVGMLAPLYRSRKLHLYIVLQALAQLAPELREQIWSIGNLVCFAVSNFDEAYEISQQLFKYHPNTEKLPRTSDIGHPIIEPDRGQYLSIANQIQRFGHRECIVRRFLDEKSLDKYARYIPQTKENPTTNLKESVSELKERLLVERGVRVQDALKVINHRTLKKNKPLQY
jgi:hypothetical protein